MVTFNQVLPAVVRICEGTPGMIDLEACCAVRDLRGRIRLVLKPRAAAAMQVDLKALGASLKAELGAYFVEPIWSTGAEKPNEARFASEVFNHAQRWSDATYDDAGTGQIGIASGVRWFKYERRLSKQEWLEPVKPTKPPWSLGADRPAIVTFYSFKGGVGRTTALVACAWQLAKLGKRVAVVDLDLEAPGLGALLGAEGARGVVDYLIDFLATGASDLTDLVVPSTTLGNQVLVLSAGTLDARYLEKLGRLDFLGGQETDKGSPIEQALVGLLHSLIKLTPRLDYILIDSRAGLHDLAGLSLHRLAHVDVLVSRASEQGYRGLDLTLASLVKRKGREQLECILVHSIAPTAGTPEAVYEGQEFLERSYEAFGKYVYLDAQKQTIALDDSTAPHTSVVVHRDIRLERFASLALIEGAFFEEGYKKLLSRIEVLCDPQGKS